MITKTSERKMAENEVFFRNHNENLHKAIDEVNKMAEEENAAPLELDGDTLLDFYCECSNETCTERVRLSLNDYKRYHKRRDAFSIRPGHEVDNIETVSVKKPDFLIVIKRLSPPQEANGLNATGLTGK
jgi:hypothetical protein